MVKVRRATDADVEALLAMFGGLDDFHTRHLPHIFHGSSTQPRSREFITGLCAGPRSVVFVAELGGPVVGQIVGRIREAPVHPLLAPRKFGEIDELFVMDSARRQGVARQLIHAVEEWVRSFGVTSIELGVWEFNVSAMRLYESLGYSTQSRRMSRTLSDD